MSAIAAQRAAHALFNSPDGRADPYPLYAALREHGPVIFSEAAGAWLVTRYDDVDALLRDRRVDKRVDLMLDQRMPSWRDHPSLVWWAERIIINQNGAEHVRLRRVAAKSMGAGAIGALRPTVERITDQLLDPMATRGGGDLMADLAAPLTLAVVGELLGIPDADRAGLAGQAITVLNSIDTQATRDPEFRGVLQVADVALGECQSYVRELLERSRRQPGADAVGRMLVANERSDAPLSDTELVDLVLIIFLAGFYTPGNQIGTGMLGLLAHPEQVAVARAHPELLPRLAEEVARYDCPNHLGARTASENLVVGGQAIPAGAPIIPVYGAANRDPARYLCPDRMDIMRTDVRPTTFGGGVHRCLGASLALLEVEVVFQRMLERFDTIELAGDAPFMDQLAERGPIVVPLRLGAKRLVRQPR